MRFLAERAQRRGWGDDVSVHDNANRLVKDGARKEVLQLRQEAVIFRRPHHAAQREPDLRGTVWHWRARRT